MTALAAVALAGGVALAVALAGGGGARGGEDAGGERAARSRPAPPPFVSALHAERRLEQRFGRAADDESAAVRCPYRIERRQLVRCEVRYSDGIPRALFVWLTRSGDLSAEIPYPATLRR